MRSRKRGKLDPPSDQLEKTRTKMPRTKMPRKPKENYIPPEIRVLPRRSAREKALTAVTAPIPRSPPPTKAGKASGKTNAPKKRRAGSGRKGSSQSCHQCRQSIFSSKGLAEVQRGKERTKCSTCTRFW